MYLKDKCNIINIYYGLDAHPLNVYSISWYSKIELKYYIFNTIIWSFSTMWNRISFYLSKVFCIYLLFNQIIFVLWRILTSPKCSEWTIPRLIVRHHVTKSGRQSLTAATCQKVKGGAPLRKFYSRR